MRKFMSVSVGIWAQGLASNLLGVKGILIFIDMTCVQTLPILFLFLVIFLEYQLPLHLEPEKSLTERAVTLVTNNLSVFSISIPLVLLGEKVF